MVLCSLESTLQKSRYRRGHGKSLDMEARCFQGSAKQAEDHSGSFVRATHNKGNPRSPYGWGMCLPATPCLGGSMTPAKRKAKHDADEEAKKNRRNDRATGGFQVKASDGVPFTATTVAQARKR